MIGEPGNQIVFGATGATALASMTTWGTARKAAGFETIIGTLFDRTDFNATSNPQKDIYNAAIRADFNVPTSSPFVFSAAPGVTYADRMVDLHAINPTKYDGIHPDSVGAENISREIAIAVDGWQATLAPLFSSPTKRFNVDQSIMITCGTPGASIYYTLDGSVPTAASTLYTGAIPVTSTTTIRAIAIAAGFPNSPVVDRVYTKVGVQVIAPSWQVSSGTPTVTGNNVSFSAGSQNVFSPVLIDSTEDFSVVASANSVPNRNVVVAIDTDIVSVNWGQTDPFVIGFFINTAPELTPFLEALDRGNNNAPTPGNVGSGWNWSDPILIRMRKVDEDAYLDTSLDAGATWVNRWIRPRAFRNITTARFKMRSIQAGNMTAWIETLVPAT
jgi:hypothetical protein